MELSLDHSNRLAVQEQHVVRRPGSGWRLSHGSLLCRAAAASRSPASPHPQRRARRRSPSEHAARERAAQRLVVYGTKRDPSQDLGANDGPLPLVPKIILSAALSARALGCLGSLRWSASVTGPDSNASTQLMMASRSAALRVLKPSSNATGAHSATRSSATSGAKAAPHGAGRAG